MEWKPKIVAVEAKLTESPAAPTLVHTGKKVTRLGTKIIAPPWTMIAG